MNLTRTNRLNRQDSEKNTEHVTMYKLKILYLAFVDHKKAFDSVELWSGRRSLGERQSRIKIQKPVEKRLFGSNDDSPTAIRKPIYAKQSEGDNTGGYYLAEELFESLNWNNKGIKSNGWFLNHRGFILYVFL